MKLASFREIDIGGWHGLVIPCGDLGKLEAEMLAEDPLFDPFSQCCPTKSVYVIENERVLFGTGGTDGAPHSQLLGGPAIGDSGCELGSGGRFEVTLEDLSGFAGWKRA